MAATSGPSSDGVGARTSAAKISCKGVWKLFGAGAKRLLAEHNGAPSEQAVADAGLIGALRDANFSVADGEIFVIMGPSGSGKSTLRSSERRGGREGRSRWAPYPDQKNNDGGPVYIAD